MERINTRPWDIGNQFTCACVRHAANLPQKNNLVINIQLQKKYKRINVSYHFSSACIHFFMLNN